MSKRAWMPLYVGDYLGDTGHLSTAHHGAYLLLMMHYWKKGSLPDDDKQLAAITKLPLRLWLDSRDTIQAFFYDGWKHKRIENELGKMERVAEKRAAAGQKGGLRSALGRVTLEYNASKSQPIGKQLLEASHQQMPSNCSDFARGFAEAGLDHSHSHKNITSTVSVERGPGKGNQIPISSELSAILTRGRGNG